MAKILVVDDEPYVVRVLAALLGRLGHECVSTTSPREALELAPAYEPELLVVDLAMPEMHGTALVREIHGRSGARRPPVVFVSGFDEREVRAPPGVRMRFLPKPFEPADLAEAVSALLLR